MSSEKESIEMELSILEKEQKSNLFREKTFSFRNRNEFRSKFTSLTPIVCTDCGKHYRVVHWCELLSNIVYIDDWQIHLLKHFQTVAEVEKRIAEQKSQQNKQPDINNANNIKAAEPHKSSGRNVCCACFGIILIFLVIIILPRFF